MNRRYRGIFMMEVLVGMFLLLALAAALAVTLDTRQKVSDRMDEKSRAIDLAEAGLIAVRTGRPVPQGVTISKLPATREGQWVQAHAKVEEASAELVTLMPEGGGQ